MQPNAVLALHAYTSRISGVAQTPLCEALAQSTAATPLPPCTESRLRGTRTRHMPRTARPLPWKDTRNATSREGVARASFPGKKNRSRVLGPLVHFFIATDHFRAPESPGPFRARASPPAEPNPGDAPRTRRAPKKGTLQCLVRALLARTRAKNAKTPAFLQKTRRSLDALRPCSGKRI